MEQISSVNSDQAPKAIGPYSQAIRFGNLLFSSGQIALDAESGEVVGDDIETQTKQVMQNLQAVLEAGGASFDRVIKSTVYITDMALFGRFNEIYGSYFQDHKPARVTVGVASLPKGVLVEVEMIAGL